jgi:DNA topoisomerase-1
VIADDENKQFASLMSRSEYWKYYFRRSIEFILLTKNLGVYKGEEVEVNNGRFGPYVRFGSAIYFFAKRNEDPLDVSMETCSRN